VTWRQWTTLEVQPVGGRATIESAAVAELASLAHRSFTGSRRTRGGAGGERRTDSAGAGSMALRGPLDNVAERCAVASGWSARDCR